MILTPDNTHWILIGGMLSDKSTDRFLTDIYYAYEVLLNAKVPDDNIDIIIDPFPSSSLPYLTNFLSKKNFQSSVDFEKVINSNDLENLMIVLDGHGNIDGLDSIDKLKPHHIISQVHNRDNLKKCAVIFGQCFAGIYNYIDMIKTDQDGKRCEYPTVCFIGASHLNSSISGSASIGPNGDIRWMANIFLFYFFQWLLNPKDIDGDGEKTLTDAFKYAGALASEHLISLKTATAHKIQKDFKALEDADTRLANSENGSVEEKAVKIEKASIERSIAGQLGVSNTNQDPWILNANKAREFVFKYQ